jgi:putative tryptophan/tyrosine transport system substrate-binding protein
MIQGKYKRFALEALLVVVLVASCAMLSGCAKQKAQRIYRVGILSGLDLFFSTAESFKSGLTDLGYVEGTNIVYDVRRTNFDPVKEEQILKEFVADKVDLIFGFNSEVAFEAKKITQGTDIPVVFANAFAEGNDLVESVRAPGGNITGVRYPGMDVAVKRLETLHEIVPQAKRIWLPFQKGYPSVASELEVLRPAAASLGLTLIEFPSSDLDQLRAELEQRSKSGDLGFDAVLLIPESLSTTKAAFEAIAKYTRPRKVPVGGSFIVTDDYGTLFAVTIDNAEVGRLAARLADSILKGARAGTIPVPSPESHLKLNQRVAQELGTKLSEDVLSRATEIIR